MFQSLNHPSIQRTLTLGVSVVMMGLFAYSAHANEGSRREPQFENAQVKVWKTIIMPSQSGDSGLALHRHENGRTVIALKGGALDVVDAEGKVINTYHWETGKAYWLDADHPGQMHADVNNTDEPIEVIVMEMK